MRVLSVYGGNRLCGETVMQGAKNSVLPILAATVLAGGPCVIHNCPRLRDVDTALRILRRLGATVVREGHTIIVDPSGIDCGTVPDDLMRRMRSSVIFLGSILARCGEAEISAPGGCDLGARPIDFHLDALRAFGASVTQDGERIHCSGPLCGGTFHLPFASVGATENSMLAAMGCSGPVVLENAAREPEIVDLAHFLEKLGAEVSGAGTEKIVIRAPEKRCGAEHRVIPDRIATVTYLCAAAAAGGEILLRQTEPLHCEVPIEILRRAGCEIRQSDDAIWMKRTAPLCAPGWIETAPYPGFPTDDQSPLMAALLQARGVTHIQETIFSNRFQQVGQLRKLGANITVLGDVAEIRPVSRLTGATMNATDLRGGAALVVGALAAEGESEIRGLQHIDRGYECIERDLRQLGANITRVGARNLQKNGTAVPAKDGVDPWEKTDQIKDREESRAGGIPVRSSS
jgi:UDP-N-acetylglucosamine 1-carboxyvinyltransferase